MDELDWAYIVDLSSNPSNKGLLDDPDIDYADDNPLCGDHVHLTLKLDADRRVVGVGWEGDGCSISMASTSLLTDDIKGKTLDELRDYSREDIFELLGFEPIHMRLKCALLSLKVLKMGAYGISIEDD